MDTIVIGQEPIGPNYQAAHLVSLRDNPRAVPCRVQDGVVILRPVASLTFANAQVGASMNE